jgi:hypothetical protein
MADELILYLVSLPSISILGQSLDGIRGFKASRFGMIGQYLLAIAIPRSNTALQFRT